MDRKEDTKLRVSRRKYEETHKEERKLLNKVWGTSIPRSDAEKIDKFLVKHGLTKVDLIMTGFTTLMEKFNKEEK